MPLVTIRTPLRPTEDPEKIRKAILNLFPDSEITVENEQATATAASLERFKTLIRNQKILDSIRNKLLAGTATGSSTISLNKQAAFVNRASLSEGRTPLGNIEVIDRVRGHRTADR